MTTLIALVGWAADDAHSAVELQRRQCSRLASHGEFYELVFVLQQSGMLPPSPYPGRND